MTWILQEDNNWTKYDNFAFFLVPSFFEAADKCHLLQNQQAENKSKSNALHCHVQLAEMLICVQIFLLSWWKQVNDSKWWLLQKFEVHDGTLITQIIVVVPYSNIDGIPQVFPHFHHVLH